MSDPNAPQGDKSGDETPNIPPPPASPYGEQPGAVPPPASPYGDQPPTPPPPASPYGDQPSYGGAQQPPSAFPPPPPSTPYDAGQAGGGYQSPPGGFPPPPPGGGYAAPGAQQPGYQSGNIAIGDAFNWGWRKFTENLGPLILGTLILGAGVYLIVGIVYAIMFAGAAASVDPNTGEISGAGAGLLGIGGLFLVALTMFLSVFVQAVVIRVSLEISYGRPVTLGSFFRVDDFGKVLVAALLVGLFSAIGIMLCILPGIIFAFFAQFTLYFVIEKNLSAMDAIKASFSLVNRNLGTVVVLYLGVLVANLIGQMLCGVGVLVSVPVGLLATVYVYRRLQGEPVAA